MRLLSHGIVADESTTIVLTLAFARMVGFREVTIGHCDGLELIPDDGHLCIHELVGVLDQCYTRTALGTDVSQARRNTLTFVDLYLALVLSVKDPANLPIQTQKSLLECLVIVIYKYPADQDTRLREVATRFVSLFLAETELSDEIQQLIFTASHAFFATRKRMRVNDELAS
jgi:hypothetical protein